MENGEIAAVLEDVGMLLQIKGANPFRIRAYENAARAVEDHAVPLRTMVASGTDLTELPGIGKDMARYITELVTSLRLVGTTMCLPCACAARPCCPFCVIRFSARVRSVSRS